MKKILLFTLALIGVSLVNAKQTLTVGTSESGATYTSLSSAISAVSTASGTTRANCDSIVLLSDIDVESSIIVNSKAFVLNLNEKTITAKNSINPLIHLGNNSGTSGGAAQMYMSSYTQNGDISRGKIVDATGNAKNTKATTLRAWHSGSLLSVENIDFSGKISYFTYIYLDYTGAHADVKNCTFTTTSSSGAGGICVGGDADGCTATVTDCTMNLQGYYGTTTYPTYGNTGWRSAGFVVNSKGMLTIKSGNYTTYASCMMLNGGWIKVEGGTYKCTSTNLPCNYGTNSVGYFGVVYNDTQSSKNGDYIEITGGVFNGSLYQRGSVGSIRPKGGVFKENSIYKSAGNQSDAKWDYTITSKASSTYSKETYSVDAMYFVDYKAYTGSSIDDVVPYADFASAYEDTEDEETINLLTTVPVTTNTTIENRTIVEKGNANAFEVTDGTLTVQGTTTITANGEYNAVNVNGANAKLIVPENQENVTIGKMTETSGEITLYAGTYNQDITAFLPTGYEQDPTTGKVKKSAPAPTKHEREVTEGNWGTMCLAYATSSYTGAKFYRVVGKSSDQLQLTVELVEGQLAAGKPYIFCATANKIVCNYTGDATTAGSDNGLIGTIDGINWSGDAAEDDSYKGLNGMYMLSSNEFVLAGDGSALRPNRAYLNLSEVYKENSSAPGRRITLNIAGTSTATNIDAISAESAKAEKVMLNGKMFIRRGNQLFDAQGALVK